MNIPGRGTIIISAQNTLAIVPYDRMLPVIIEDIRKEVKSLQQFFRDETEWMLRTYVPVRSGELLDTLLNTLLVDVVGNRVVISASTPAGYPITIKNPSHIMDKGWGPLYNPIHLIANRKVLRYTARGAIYLLNDPQAISDYTSILQNFVLPMVAGIIEDMSFRYTVEVTLPQLTQEEEEFGAAVESPTTIGEIELPLSYTFSSEHNVLLNETKEEIKAITRILKVEAAQNKAKLRAKNRLRMKNRFYRKR